MTILRNLLSNSNLVDLAKMTKRVIDVKSIREQGSNREEQTSRCGDVRCQKDRDPYDHMV